MESAKLNDWLQVIGLFGVIASLVFVGFQLRQDHRIALANTYQARTASLVDSFHARAANSDALSAELRFRGINPNDPVSRPSFDIPESAGTMTELEFRAGIFVALATWQQWNNLHYQYELGFMPDDSWLRLRAIIKRNFERQTLAVAAYESVQTTPALDEVVEEIIAEVEAEKSN